LTWPGGGPARQKKNGRSEGSSKAHKVVKGGVRWKCKKAARTSPTTTGALKKTSVLDGERFRTGRTRESQGENTTRKLTAAYSAAGG